MIDLFKNTLPDAITVDGNVYPIHTDFRYFILFYRLSKLKRPISEYVCMFNADIPEDMNKAIIELTKFANPPKELPRPIGDGNGEIIIDFDLDSDFIYSAFLEQYGIDLTLPPEQFQLHWYKFMALLNGLHDTKLNEIMGFRGYEDKKTDYKTQMNNLKQAWRIEYITEEEQKIIDDFNSLFE